MANNQIYQITFNKLQTIRKAIDELNQNIYKNINVIETNFPLEEIEVF